MPAYVPPAELCSRRTALAHLLRLAGGAVLAGAALPAQARLATPGALLLEEDFRTHASYTKERLPVKEGWQVRVAHGTWTRTDDGVRATWQTGHSPVLVYEGAFGDAVIELDFRYRVEPGRWSACRLSPTNTQLNPRAYSSSVWANVDFRSRAAGLVLEQDQWSPGHITQVSRVMNTYAPDTWHTLRMELVGNEVLATCNGKEVRGSHEKFGLPKNSIWIGTGESTTELRRLRVYAATPAART